MNKNILFQISDACNSDEIQIDSNINQEELFGQIVLNKTVGIAYERLSSVQLHKELKKALNVFHDNYIYKSTVFKRQLKHFASILKEFDCNYSLLKGSFLSTNIYKSGQRISNDFDILIDPKDISSLQNILISNGFIQGSISSSKEIIPATRREIIESRMNFGETIPFVKFYDGEAMTVDINFSMDYKMVSNGNLINDFLEQSEYASFEDVIFKVLNPIDFIIHLSCHLYKEATTYDWVARRRDLMLYKFSDINVFIHRYASQEYFNKLATRIKEWKLEKECYYTFENSSIIYPKLKAIDGFEQMINSIKPDCLDFMKQIIYPREKKLFEYDLSFTDWFFSNDRVSSLKEIPYDRG